MHCRGVAVLLCSLAITDVVYSTIWSKTLDQSDGYHVVKLPSTEDPLRNKLIRTKRDTPTGDKLSVNATTLQDKNHNEAIVHWSGKGSKVIFVLTREHYANGSVPSSKLYRSTDYGTSFTVVEPGVGALIRYYYSSPSNTKKLIFTDLGNKYLYITEDEGKTFTKSEPLNFSPGQLQFHPNKEDYVLAYDYISNELHISTDLGHKWKKVSSYVNPRFFWADSRYDKNDSVIHIEVQDPGTGKYQYTICGLPYCTEMNFDDETPKDIDINSLVIINEYIFVQKSTGYSSTLYVSWNRKPFKPAYFPIDVHPQDFNIINADEHQVFIAADTAEKMVNLYLSDTTGQYYIESLKNLVVLRSYQGSFDADLYEVRGMKGIFIANTQHLTEGAKSSITFDQGGEWRQILPPAKDLSGGLIDCTQPECSLHLHLSYSRKFGIIPPLSEENAPGIIMAHGTVGKGLSRTNVTMFMSNDTGVTWKAIFAGNHLYNIIDQGGAMVVVPQERGKEGTNVIKYSCTEGEKWLTHTFSDPNLQVDGVLNEPGITTRIVSIYGHQTKDSAWMIVKVNFSSILTRKCDDSDYYDWTTLDKLGGNLCVLGMQMTFKRRKQEALCYNGEDYEHANHTVKCECRKEDYECDYGYKEGKDGSCTEEDWFNPAKPPFECPEDTKYNKSQGYRKIAADNCTGDALDKKYKPVETSCPKTKPQELSITTVDSRTVGIGTLVTLTLVQKRGSKKSTTYTWDFGDKSDLKPFSGYDKARKQTHTYTKKGMFTITVNASNTEGTANASAYLHVEDAIKTIYVDEPHGAKAKYPVQFEAWPLSKTWSGSSGSDVHFLWTFGDEKNQKPLLTYSHRVNHTYDKPGNYSLVVQAVNGVGSVFKKLTLTVYGTLKTVQVSFNNQVERLNKNTALWRKQFADELQNAISEQIEVMKHRLEVVVLPGRPTKADVSILPINYSSSSEDPTIDIIVNRLLAKVENKTLYMLIGNDDFGDGKINITKAVILNADVPDSDGKHSRNLVAVFVCVPILMIGIFVSFLVVLYYRRKFSHVRRYAMLQQSDAEDRLLGEDDNDDEDVPPLDLNPDRGRGGRLAMDDDDDDDRSDLFQPG